MNLLASFFLGIYFFNGITNCGIKEFFSNVYQTYTGEGEVCKQMTFPTSL